VQDQTNRRFSTDARIASRVAYPSVRHDTGRPKLVRQSVANVYRRKVKSDAMPPDQNFAPQDQTGLTVVQNASPLDNTRGTTHVGGFLLGTSILTDKGKVPVETLRAGSKVFTLDHGLQAVDRVIVCQSNGIDQRAPIKISKGALRNSADLWVCPDQKMILRDWKAELMFGDNEVLISAHQLVDDKLIYTDKRTQEVTYFHLMFDQHQVVMAEGIATESLNPFGYNPAERDSPYVQLVAQMPELKFRKARFCASTRKVLRPHEARLLVNQIKRPPAA